MSPDGLAAVAPTGSGPGAFTPDGCSVELYRRLAPHAEPEIIASAVAPPASLLELGAGAGRITGPLVALGYRVTAVEESAEMASHISGAEVVLSDIAALALGRTFDAILMMSYLVAIPDRGQRRSWLRTCRQHVALTGRVILQRHGAAWFDAAGPYERDDGDIHLQMVSVDRPSPKLITATMRYRTGGRTWEHTYTHDRWNDEDMAADLAACDLRFERFLTPGQDWLTAVPAEIA